VPPSSAANPRSYDREPVVPYGLIPGVGRTEARADVEPEEFEEVCFGSEDRVAHIGRHKALVLRAKSEGKNPAYYVLGQTEAGRNLFCVVISFPDASRGVDEAVLIRTWVHEKLHH
jgi:hypothetical protein